MLTRFLLLFTVIIWGWTFVATRVCLEFVNPAELLGLRLLIGLPLLLAVILFKKVRFNFSGSDWKKVSIGSAVITLHFLIQITGLQYTTATNTGWIISVSPLVMAVLSFAFLHEKIGKAQVIAIAVATFGIFLLMSKGNFSQLGFLTSLGDWLVLISAHTWAIYTVVTRDLSRSRNPLAITMGVMAPALVVMTVYMMFTSDWGKIAAMPARGVWALLFLAIPGLALGHWFWQEGVAKIGATRAGIYLYLEPVATTALAIPLLNEPFGWATAVGGGLVLVGVYIGQGSKRD
jgi:drug/metabolite transporter (DMT)-like permease